MTYYTVCPDEGTPDGSVCKLYERRGAAMKYARKLLDSTESGQVTVSHGDTLEYLYKVDGGGVVHEVVSDNG